MSDNNDFKLVDVEPEDLSEDEFVLTPDDVWLILDYVDGQEINEDEFHALMRDMIDFVGEIEASNANAGMDEESI